MSLVVYLGGGILLGALLRWWRPSVGWGWIAGYWLLAGAFFAAPLTSDALQVPTDIAYLWPPSGETVAERVIPANALLGDVPLQMIPFKALTRDRWLHFEAPLWANEMGTGQPLLGDGQSAPFSLLGVLSLPLPAVRALPVEAALRLFISLLLTHALLRALGAGRAGAAFAAVAFTFSVFSICWAYHPHGMAIGWLPGIMLGVVLLYRGERGGGAGLVACALGMALSGHPETLAHTALATTVLAAALAAIGGGVGRWRFLGRLAVAVAIIAGLAAPVLLPILEALPEGARVESLARTSVEPPAFSAATAVVVVDPLAYGSPRDLDWSGPRALNYNELCSGYAGLLALGLALAGAIVLRGRVLAIVLGGGVALAIAFGVGPFIAALEALPPFDHAANARLRFVWVLAIAVGAGLSLEPLLARRQGRWLGAASAGSLGLALAFLPRPAAAPWQRAWWLATVLGCGVTAAAFLWTAVRSGRPSAAESAVQGLGGPAWLPWLAVACLALDLGLLNGRFLPVLPRAFDLAPPAAVEVLQGASRNASAPFRVIGHDYVLLPNLAALYGLWDPRSDDPMEPARATLVTGRALRSSYAVGDPMLWLGRSLPGPFLSYLAVRFVLTRHRDELPLPWQEVWDGPGGAIWRNPGALPLFFMPATWRKVDSAAQALSSTLANTDFASAAVVETAGESTPEVLRAPEAPARARTVRLAKVRANSFDLEATGPGGGLVVSSISSCRGWQLSIDGRPANLLRVNAGFLGFMAPPHWQNAELEYRPAGWVWGLRVLGLTLVALLAALLRASVARRRDPAVASAHGASFRHRSVARQPARSGSPRLT